MKLAALMRRDKYLLSAMQTLEAGKNYAEAEADVCEALDFADYYARVAIHLDGGVPVVPYPGEENESHLIPIGAGAVTASFVFFFSLAYGARLLAPVFAGPGAWRVLDLFVALVMWTIAASLILT